MWAKFLAFSLSGTLVTIYILKRYFGGSSCKCKNNLDGKVIIITGASSGIGRETAYILASKGAELILACRNREIGLEVASEIRRKTQNPSVDFEELDLSRFESIIDFVNRFKRRGSKLYGLINNAGIFYVPYKLTDNGFDVTLQTNYLGPFLLTYQLLGALKEGAPSRVVNIASESHRYLESLDVPSLVLQPHAFNEFVFYGATKLCLMLFTTKLAKLLDGMENVKPSIKGNSTAMLNQTPWLPRRKYRRKNRLEVKKHLTAEDILDTRYKRLKKHIEFDDVKHRLSKKEMELRIEIAGLEKKSAETDLKMKEIEQDLHRRQTEADLKYKEKESALKIKMLESELKFKEEEQVHKRKVWEMETELLNKKLNA